MIFPQSFFDEEIRDDFTVPEMMKRAWAAALEVLEVIDDVCARNGLKWYAYGGTLLGCVRHHGFIPWDDDIDICMLRADYDKFFEIADAELPGGFAVSGIYATEPRLIAANKEPQGRVIADETFFTLPKYMDRFHAFPYMRIGIDIFPMDYLPAEVEEQRTLIATINEMQKTARFMDVYRKNGTLAARVESFRDYLTGLSYNPNNDDELAHAIWYASDRLAASTPPSDKVFDVLYLSERSHCDETEGYRGADPSGFEPSIDMPFEHVTLRAPANYDSILKAEFGDDYMTPVRFAGDHEYPFYKSQEKAFVELLKESGVDTPVDEFCRNWHKMNGGT